MEWFEASWNDLTPLESNGDDSNRESKVSTTIISIIFLFVELSWASISTFIPHIICTKKHLNIIISEACWMSHKRTSSSTISSWSRHSFQKTASETSFWIKSSGICHFWCSVGCVCPNIGYAISMNWAIFRTFSDILRLNWIPYLPIRFLHRLH